MILPDVAFRRFATLEFEVPTVAYNTVGYAARFCDTFVPEDEWWMLTAARWRYVSVASNLTGTGDIIYAFNVVRTVEFTETFDVIRRRVGIDHLLWGRYIRYGIDYTEPQYGITFPEAQVLPPRSRVTLLAQAFGTSLPVYFPSITAPASLDVAIYTQTDDAGITGKGTVAAPRISEWWRQ